jgi:hypothetical protein
VVEILGLPFSVAAVALGVLAWPVCVAVPLGAALLVPHHPAFALLVVAAIAGAWVARRSITRFAMGFALIGFAREWTVDSLDGRAHATVYVLFDRLLDGFGSWLTERQSIAIRHAPSAADVEAAGPQAVASAAAPSIPMRKGFGELCGDHVLLLAAVTNLCARGMLELSHDAQSSWSIWDPTVAKLEPVEMLAVRLGTARPSPGTLEAEVVAHVESHVAARATEPRGLRRRSVLLRGDPYRARPVADSRPRTPLSLSGQPLADPVRSRRNAVRRGPSSRAPGAIGESWPRSRANTRPQ